MKKRRKTAPRRKTTDMAVQMVADQTTKNHTALRQIQNEHADILERLSHLKTELETYKKNNITPQAIARRMTALEQSEKVSVRAHDRLNELERQVRELFTQLDHCRIELQAIRDNSTVEEIMNNEIIQDPES